jgi:hypothetical protein
MSCDQLNIKDADDMTSGEIRRRAVPSWETSLFEPMKEVIVGQWQVATQNLYSDQANLTQKLVYLTLIMAYTC